MTDRISSLEKAYVIEVLDSEFRSSRATNMVARAELAFANLMKSDFAIGFVNGTATLHTALEALEIGPGDEVIVPPLTMSATAFAVLQSGATPRFADVDPNTFQISPESIRSLLSEKTKAVITVALYGSCPDYDSILEILQSIPVIEDNAEAFGTTYHDKPIGTVGVMGSYSFQSSKHLTAGEGGMLLMNDELLAEKVRRIQSLGYGAVGAKRGKISKFEIQDPNYLRHVSMGWNYRLSELNAAVILAQIERQEELIDVRVRSANALLEVISNCKWLRPQEIHDGANHTYWALPVLLENEKVSWHAFRDAFVGFGGKGIYAAWQLSYLEPAFLNRKFLGREKGIEEKILSEYARGLCPIAEVLQPKILAFRTNEWDIESQNQQKLALEKTIEFFS
jgi:perosamine synthetase